MDGQRRRMGTKFLSSAEENGVWLCFACIRLYTMSLSTFDIMKWIPTSCE